MLYHIHATLRARPADLIPGPMTPAPHALATWRPGPSGLTAQFEVSFEACSEILSAWPRMFLEPDGSFVWVGEVTDADPAWQLDGNLYDHAGRLFYVELHGTCPVSAFDRLLTAVGWPTVAILFACARDGYLLDEPTFRRFAQAA